MNYITSKDGFWSNEEGWVTDISIASSFEEQVGNLPIGDSVSWSFLPYGMNDEQIEAKMEDLLEEAKNIPIGTPVTTSYTIQLLDNAKNKPIKVYTPAGLMVAYPTLEADYPGIAIEVNGRGGVCFEWDSLSKSIRAHIYQPDVDEPETIDLDFFKALEEVIE